MKNIFKLMGLALIAGSMMFVACNKDDEGNGGNGNNTPEPVKNEVKVTFGSNSWTAQYSKCVVSAQQQAIVLAACEGTASTSYPQIQFYMEWDGAPAAGTFTGEPSVDLTAGEANAGNPYLWYFTDDQNIINFGGNPAGNWWANPVEMNITTLDLDALTISATATATMADLLSCLQNGTAWENAETRALTLTVTNLEMTDFDAE